MTVSVVVLYLQGVTMWLFMGYKSYQHPLKALHSFKLYCSLQWYPSWEATATRDHLSWQTTPSFSAGPIHFNITEPVTRDTCLDIPHFCGQWGGLSRQFPLYSYHILHHLQPGTTVVVYMHRDPCLQCSWSNRVDPFCPVAYNPVMVPLWYRNSHSVSHLGSNVSLHRLI